MKQCTFESCEKYQKYLTKGYCSTHYKRLRLYGDAKYVTPMSQRKGNTRHGMKHTPEYRTWCHMKERCHNPNNKDYAIYGGRGITVADEWNHDFMAFYNHIGPKPTKWHSIDRINTNGNYEPGNVRWADDYEQSHNRRTLKTNMSGVPGVHYSKNVNKWCARKTVDGKRVVVGYFANIGDAAASL